MDEKIYEIIKSTTELVKNTDEINKRLCRTLAIGIISFSLTLVLITGFYFFSTYDYATVNQDLTQEVKQEVTQTTK